MNTLKLVYQYSYTIYYHGKLICPSKFSCIGLRVISYVEEIINTIFSQVEFENVNINGEFRIVEWFYMCVLCNLSIYFN